jgi:hypothetical protein
MLLLPHHHEFAETLANLPFFYKEIASNTCETMHVLQNNPNHLPEIATTSRLQEYLLGGEIDEYVEYVDGYADDDAEETDDLLNWELGDEWLGSISG